MRPAKPERSGNQLISASPTSSQKRLLDQGDIVHLKFGEILCEPGEPYRHAYFPLTSFISLVSTVSGHPPLEMGLIGSEGMLGATLALGITLAPLQAVVQGDGDALRVTTAGLRAELKASSGFRDVLNRYLYVLTEQLSQNSACVRFHDVEPRLARWLLMSHDRAHADHFHLTHGFLADMLGVLRSAVTIAAGSLQRKGLIRYTRGEITVTNRKGLEGVACECYEAVIQDYRRLLI